jgi:fatty acid CoA ligase FadD9
MTDTATEPARERRVAGRVSLDTFVDWLIAGGHRIERIDDYDEWLSRFTEAMQSLPDNQRKI